MMIRSAAFMLVTGAAFVPALAGPPASSHRVEQVQRLAHEVDDSARSVRSGVFYRGFPSPREQRALRQMDLLVSRASAFHEAIERRPFSWKTREQLDALVQAHARAAGMFPSLRASIPALRGFRRLSAQVDRLAEGYDALLVAPRDHRHDPWDDDDRIGEWKGRGR